MPILVLLAAFSGLGVYLFVEFLREGHAIGRAQRSYIKKHGTAFVRKKRASSLIKSRQRGGVSKDDAARYQKAIDELKRALAEEKKGNRRAKKEHEEKAEQAAASIKDPSLRKEAKRLGKYARGKRHTIASLVSSQARTLKHTPKKVNEWRTEDVAAALEHTLARLSIGDQRGTVMFLNQAAAVVNEMPPGPDQNAAEAAVVETAKTALGYNELPVVPGVKPSHRRSKGTARLAAEVPVIKEVPPHIVQRAKTVLEGFGHFDPGVADAAVQKVLLSGVQIKDAEQLATAAMTEIYADIDKKV